MESSAADSRYRPFCSERCQLLDLSAWTTERFRIPGEPATPAEPPSDDDAS